MPLAMLEVHRARRGSWRVMERTAGMESRAKTTSVILDGEEGEEEDGGQAATIFDNRRIDPDGGWDRAEFSRPEVIQAGVFC